MVTFCIPKLINKRLQKAINDGSINLDELLTKSQDEVDMILEKHLGKEYSAEVADRFVRKFETQLPTEEVVKVIKSFKEIDDLVAKEGYDTTGKITKDWAIKRILLDDYMEKIVNPNSKLNFLDTIAKGTRNELQKIKDQDTLFKKIMEGGKAIGNVATTAAWKSVKASIDASFTLRQGFKVLLRDPKVWWNSVKESFDILGKTFKPEDRARILLEHKARLISQQNYSRLVNEGKLAVGVLEDWFPTTIAEKVPGFGKLIKGSSEAFSIFTQGSRFELANDLMNSQMQRLGRDLTKDEIKGLGQLVNSITSRGSLGRLESQSGLINKLLWSGRYIRSQVDTFIMPFNPKLTPELRKEALKESIKVFGTITSLMATASLFTDVDWNMTSTNFGKMKVGNSWVDLTAGLGGYIRLAAQNIAQQRTTSSGNTIKFGKGYKPETSLTNITGFARNKLAPAPSTIVNLLGGSDAVGNKNTIKNVITNLAMPISPGNTYGFLTNEDTITGLILSGLDIFGQNVTNRY